MRKPDDAKKKREEKQPPKRNGFADAAREHVRGHIETFRELANR